MGLALDLEDYHPSVLLHCWLGHLTCKIVSEMTYNVSSGTLNPTIPSVVDYSYYQQMVSVLLLATQASNEGDGFTEFCARSDWNQYNELCHSVLSEEAEKSGYLQFIGLSDVLQLSLSTGHHVFIYVTWTECCLELLFLSVLCFESLSKYGPDCIDHWCDVISQNIFRDHKTYSEKLKVNYFHSRIILWLKYLCELALGKTTRRGQIWYHTLLQNLTLTSFNA